MDSKFKKELNLIYESIFEGASTEEVEKRHLEYNEIKLKKRLENIKSRSKVNSDGSLDVEGNVGLTGLGLKEIPIKFNKINGDFYCSFNELVTLKNCPIEVNGTFSCSWNQLTSLEGCPKIVDRDFHCHHNKSKFTRNDVKKYCKVLGFTYED